VLNVAERPLRLIIFTILYIFDTALTAEVGLIDIQVIPPQFGAWLVATIALFIVAMLILLATLWLRSKMGYIIALIYFAVSVAFDAYAIYAPNIPINAPHAPYAPTFLIIESTMLALLLSLWNYFTKP
jgi:hypothetical protein